MATSGSKSVAVTSWDTLKFSWSVKSQSVANNTTTISWKLQLIATSDGYISSSASKAWSVTVNGTKYSGTNTVGISNNSTKTLASGTTTITHNADGTKSFSYSFSQQFDITFNSWIGTITGSGSGTLNTIPRASQPSCITWPEHTQNVGSFGDTISIHTNRASSSFTHTLRYQFGSKSGTIATGVTTGTTWTIPKSLMDLIPSVLSGSGTIYADTYNGSTLIGTKYCGFTATVPTTSDCYPSASLKLEDTTGWDDTYGSPVQGLSKIKITVTPTLAYSSPIASYSVSADGTKYTTATATTGALKTAGNSPVTATIKDKRGRSGSVSYTMKVLAYNQPNISKLTVHRCDEDGTENEQGEFIRVLFSAAITSLNSKNTATYKLRYKKTTDTAYTEVTLSALANTYTVTNGSYTFAADSSNSYDVEVEAKDRHGTATRSTSASTAFTLINWGADGTSMAVGKVAEKANTFEVGLNTELLGDTRQAGNSFAFQPSAFSGEKGYTLLAVITLNTLNVNAPIVFVINRRGALCPMTVYVRFASSSTTTDPDLGSITYEGDNYGAFLIKEATSTWKLYVDNTTGWSNPCLQEWYTTDNQKARLAISFPSEQVTELPTPYYRATPAKMQSLLDFIYPVNSVYISYSHVNPGTLFGGTWERITNAFLWATDASGTIGQTGGEKEHKLIVAELPAHSHSISVANTTTGSTAAANKVRYNSTNTSYIGNLSTETQGSGLAHNNMPPYIQVSIWRRTA